MTYKQNKINNWQDTGHPILLAILVVFINIKPLQVDGGWIKT